MSELNGGSRRAWSWGLLLVAVWGIFCVTAATTPSVFAQDGKKDAAKKEEASKEAGKEGGEAPAEKKEEQNFLIWIAETSGLIGLVLLLLSIWFVSIVVKMFFELRVEVAAPPEVLEECEELLKAKDFMGVYKLVKADESFFSVVMRAGLAEMPAGLAESREVMDRIGDAQTVEMEKKISMLAVLGSLGPMIGLLGTLKGMIASFSVIAISGQGLDPGKVAAGISEALVLTFEGVFLSVPAIFFYALFRNRIAAISTSTMLAADELIRRVFTYARAKTPAASTAAST
ncbi:MAG: MotA/TolQ/ExbB proton channel family protein [Planctomycetales bacterium]|nr:MotA/TolQ/ExbB proton channel family protein [Planctomycetales bacterium]